MESQRTKLLVGFGISVVSVLVTYAVYRTLKQSKTTQKRNRPSHNLEKPSETELALVDPNEFLNSTPTAASSECNLLLDVDTAAETSRAKVEQSFEDSSSVSGNYVSAINVPQEGTIVPTEMSLQSCSPVNLDKTVTLNTSDFSSQSLIDVDHSYDAENSAVTTEVVTELSDDRAAVVEDNGIIEEIIPVAVAPVHSTGCPVSSSALTAVVEESMEVTTIDLTSSPPTALEDSTSEVVEITPIKVVPEQSPVTHSNCTETVVEETIGVKTIDLTSMSLSAEDEFVDIRPPVLASSDSTQNALDDLESTMQSHETVNAQTVCISSDTIVSKSTERVNEELEEINKSFTSMEKKVKSIEVKFLAKENVVMVPDEHSISGNDSELSSDSINGNRSITADSGIGLCTGSSNLASSNVNGAEPKDTTDSRHNAQLTAEAAATQMANGTCHTLSDAASLDIPSMTKTDSIHQCNGGESSENASQSSRQASTEDASVDTNGPQELTKSRSSLISPTGSTSSPQSPSSQTSLDGVKKEKHVIHRFMMPAKLCGLFIGKSGKNISALKRHTNTLIKILREPTPYNIRYCEVAGPENNVEHALRVIKKQYPEVDVSQVDNLGMPKRSNLTLSPDRMQLHLPMGVPVDAIVSNIVSAGHVFVQQPTQPSFSSYQRLSDCLNSCYADGSTVPPLPDSVEDGVLCVAPINGMWYRAHIMSFSADKTGSEVKLVDVGGYAMAPTVSLRQIRQDFLGLPFQAVECYLSNIEPLDGESFTIEAQEALHQMTAGQMVQCQPTAVADNNVPYIHIVAQIANQAVVVNRELANRGLVKWFNMDS